MVNEAATILGWSSNSTQCVWPGRSPGFGSDWVEGITTRISAAHNAESLAADLSQVERPCVILLGMTAKKDLKETLASLVSQFQSNSLLCGLVLTQPISGRNPAVQIESLNKTLKDLNIKPDSAHENPLEAFRIASEMAVEGNYDLIVLGSVYLVGDLFGHMAESNDWDLWESLSSH